MYMKAQKAFVEVVIPLLTMFVQRTPKYYGNDWNAGIAKLYNVVRTATRTGLGDNHVSAFLDTAQALTTSSWVRRINADIMGLGTSRSLQTT